jgi:hypothetical protein
MAFVVKVFASGRYTLSPAVGREPDVSLLQKGQQERFLQFANAWCVSMAKALYRTAQACIRAAEHQLHCATCERGTHLQCTSSMPVLSHHNQHIRALRRHPLPPQLFQRLQRSLHTRTCAGQLQWWCCCKCCSVSRPMHYKPPCQTDVPSMPGPEVIVGLLARCRTPRLGTWTATPTSYCSTFAASWQVMRGGRSSYWLTLQLPQLCCNRMQGAPNHLTDNAFGSVQVSWSRRSMSCWSLLALVRIGMTAAHSSSCG